MNQFYAIFANGSKILFYANSIKAAKCFKTKYAKANNTFFVQGGHAYTLTQIGENVSEFKNI